jgi:hypothetical protein
MQELNLPQKFSPIKVNFGFSNHSLFFQVQNSSSDFTHNKAHLTNLNFEFE